MPMAAVYFMSVISDLVRSELIICLPGSMPYGSRVFDFSFAYGRFVYPKSRPLFGTLGTFILSNTDIVLPKKKKKKGRAKVT